MSASPASEAAFCALIIAASCSVAAAQGTAPPPAVSVTPVVSREVTETIDYIGRLTAVDKVDVVARVPGFLEERKFKETIQTSNASPLASHESCTRHRRRLRSASIRILSRSITSSWMCTGACR